MWRGGGHHASRAPRVYSVSNTNVSYMSPISNNYYLFPIHIGEKVGNLKWGSPTGNNKEEYVRADAYWGKLKFLYKVMNVNITLEDEVIINGERYVILRDITRNNIDSIFALHLKEDY
jgi:hypothetical protein